MLAVMIELQESFRRNEAAIFTKKEQWCSLKKQSEMWGIIGKREAQNRPPWPNTVPLHLHMNKNYYYFDVSMMLTDARNDKMDPVRLL